MKKLVLVYPKTRSEVTGYGETESWSWPPLALGYLAAFTPEDWDVRIIDEYHEQIDFDTQADLVGITALTVHATRAYDISAEFRKRGKPVVLGGIHVSMLPDEAAERADAIVIGEAESVWKRLLADFENGSMQKVYRGEQLPLVNLPVPRRDLFSEKYEVAAVQTARGCPFACEYCSVTAFLGSQYRMRPVNEVLDELETIRERFVLFTDDNFFGVRPEHVERAVELCKGMIDRKLKKIWLTQSTVNIADNDEALKYAARSGCKGIVVGIESVLPDTWKEMNKGINLRVGLEGIKRAVERFHKHGIFVLGPFIFGSNNDDVAVFDKSVDFIREVNIDAPLVGIVTPFPGTKFYDRLEREGSLLHSNFPDDWDKYDTEHVYYKSEKLDPCDLVRGVDYVINRTFARKAIWRQAVKTLLATRSLSSTVIAFKMNADSAKFNDYPRGAKFRLASQHDRK